MGVAVVATGLPPTRALPVLGSSPTPMIRTYGGVYLLRDIRRRILLVYLGSIGLGLDWVVDWVHGGCAVAAAFGGGWDFAEAFGALANRRCDVG